MNRLKKRGLSLLLAFSLLLTPAALPVSAAETETDPLARFSGSGTLTDPYQIATAADLAAMRDYINSDAGTQSGHYWRQTADISLAGYENWSPIGRTDKTNSTMEKTYRFSGTYDGDGHTVSDMTIRASGAEAVGLFGNISRAEIRDLTVEGSITHTTATGHSADYGIGGVVGRTYEYYEAGVLNPDSACTLRGVTSRVTITAAAMAGGVLGTTEVDTTFENCVFEGAIVLAMTSEYAYDVFGTGGICGMSQGCDVFTGCVNRGSITCTKGDVSLGGIVGFASNGAVTVVESCYNTGALSGAVTSANTGIGGIVGKRTNGYASDNNETLKMTIRNCYSSGRLTAADGGTTGGIVGRCVAAAQNGEPIWTVENLSHAYALKDTASYAVRGVTADGKVRNAPGDAETAELLRDQEDMAEGLGSAFRTENGALILPWESAAARFPVRIVGIDAQTGREISVRVDLDYEVGLAPGQYSFTASKNGYESVSGSFGVVNSEKTVYVILTPARYTYTLTLIPADAELTLETELGEVAPERVTRGENAAVYVFSGNSGVYGDYTLRAAAFGYDAAEQTLELTEDAQARLELLPAARHRVTLSAGETVLTDVRVVSERFGAAAAAERDGSYLLPDGDYLLTAYADGYRKAAQRFAVSGADCTVTVVLTADVWDGMADTDWYDAAAARYELRTTAELAGLAQLVNGGVTFAGKTVALCADLDLGGARWTAIGSSTVRSFQGVFDGQGHKISGLCLDAPEVILDDYYEKYKLVWPGNAGLFGYTSGAAIENLTIETVEFDLAALKAEYGDSLLETDANTLNCAGGAAAYAVNTSFRRVETQGTLTAAGSRIGGLAGEAKGCEFTACVNRAAVSGAYGTGGIAGQCDAATRFYACANHGDVSGWYWKYMENKTQHGVGGIAGLSTSSGAARLEACVNTGAVRGNSMLGGLLGAGRAALTDCYNTGAVTITDDEVTVTAAATDADGNPVPAVMGVQDGLCAGGLVGYSALLALENSFSRAAVTDGSGRDCTANALVGAATACSAENCYFAAGSDTLGEQTDTLAAAALGAAFCDGTDGWPALTWEAAESEYPVVFAVSYDTPANAGWDLTLTVNGEALSGTELRLPAGRYVWTAAQDGYESASGSFEIVGKGLTIPAALTAQRYTLTISGDADFRLTQDGETVEPVSTEGGITYRLYNGSYSYVAARRNCVTQRGTVSVAFGDESLNLVLDSAATYPVFFSATRDGTPFFDWTAVLTDADGFDYGSITAAGSLALMDGTYRYHLTALGCEPLDGEFIVSGGVCMVNAAMESRRASVWDGTADTAWYDSTKDSFALYTAAELAGLAQLVNAGTSFQGRTVTLENDLDLGSGDWTAIGTYYNKPFSGTFDGNGHSITLGGAFTSSNTAVLGLFGYTGGAALRNLILTGSCKDTQSYTAYTTAAVGTLVGWAKDTVIENVSVRTALRAKLLTNGSVCFAGVGGLAGIMDGGSMTACSSIGSVTLIMDRGTNRYPHAGGLAGRLGGSMTGCYSSAAVTAEGGYIARAGGLAGGQRSGLAAASNYAVGSVSAEGADTAYVSALIGEYEADASNLYLSTLSAQGGTAVSAEELQSEETAATLGEHFRYVPGTYPMNVWESAAASLAVSRPPDKTAYNDLDAFDDSGLELTVTYANGGTAVVTSGWVVLNGASLAPGQTAVLVSYLGCTAAVPVTVTQTTHFLPDADLAFALRAPRVGETGASAALTDAQRARFTAETVWLHAGETVSGAFEADTYYYARVTLTIAPRTDMLYAFAPDAMPAADGAYEVRNVAVSEDGKTLSFLATYRLSDTLTDRAGHLYYEGLDDAKSRPLADTITLTLNGAPLASYTLRELETLALTGCGAEHGGFTGLPLYALLARSEGVDLLAADGTVTLGGKTLTLGALRADADILLAYGKDGAPLDALMLSTGGAVTEIAVTAERAETCLVSFRTDAAVGGTVLTVRDSDGNPVYTGAPGTVTLRRGEDYTYSAVTPGYSTVSGTVRGAGSVTLHMVAAWSGAYAEPERDETGAYLIASAENLAWFHRESTLVSLERAKELSGADVKLTADISMLGYDWTPLCPTESARTLFYAGGLRYYCGGQFTGSFDGQGHTIYDLSIDWSRGTDNTTARMEAYGLIGYLRGGTVRDLGVEIRIAVTDSTVNEGDWLCVGAIAGFAQTGARISGCRAAAEISVTVGSGPAGFGCYVGGLVGAISSPLEQSAVENSYSTGTAVVSGSCRPALGGIAGSSRAGNSRIDRCWSDMRLTIRPGTETESGYLGGIIALIDGVSTSALPEVSYCFALNPVLDGGSAAIQAGRVVGRGDRFGNEGRYNYALETMQILHADISGYDESDSGYRSGWGRDLAPENALKAETYTNVLWNYDEETEEETTVWTFLAGSYPRLAWEGEAAPEPAGFAVTVENSAGAAVSLTDGSYSGELTFTVTNAAACAVLVRRGESWTALPGKGSYTLTVDAELTVRVVLRGDLNGDGGLNSDDAALAKRMAAGLETASAEQLLNLGAERVTGFAALRVQRAAAGLYAFAW